MLSMAGVREGTSLPHFLEAIHACMFSTQQHPISIGKMLCDTHCPPEQEGAERRTEQWPSEMRRCRCLRGSPCPVIRSKM